MIRHGLIVLLIGLLAGAASAQVPEGLWEARAAEVYNLERGESVQFRVKYDDIPVRSWILTVEGGLLTCDLNILRHRNESLIYQQNDESTHRVKLPWGRDESLAITLTANTRIGGSYTVKFLAPPPEDTPRSYGYDINRALESFEAGDIEKAESHIRDAILCDDEDAGIGYLLLANLTKNRGELEKAAGLLDMALDAGLPESLEPVERELKKQLAMVRHRLSPALIDADKILAGGDGRAAAERINEWLDGQVDRVYSDWELCEANRRLGHAAQLDNHAVGAQEYLDLALSQAHDPAQKGLVYHRMGLLQLENGNRDQARRAIEAARDLGLPPDLDESALTILNDLDKE